MDFGKVPEEELDNIDFFLPADHPANKLILNKEDYKKTKVYAGCAKWGRKEWVGKIYPPKTKEKDYLSFYVKQFNCIELNATHYRIYDGATIEKWADTAGDGFIFCPKFPQVISHIRWLKNCQKETEEFYNSIAHFGKKLGTCFLQLSDKFNPPKFGDLKKYLESLPPAPAVCLELRHPGWYSDPSVYDETFAMLRELNMGSVITDTAGRRDMVHMRLSNGTAFIRFVGNHLHPTDYTRVDDWVKRLKKWLPSGLDTVYFMMHMPEEKDSPELMAYVVKELNKKCGLSLEEPKFDNT